MAKKEQKRICEICGGTGQVSFFQGVSRFLLSTDECDACAGTGLLLRQDRDEAEKDSLPAFKKRKMKKK